MNTAYMICYAAFALLMLFLAAVLVANSKRRDKPPQKRYHTFISYDMKDKSFSINHGVSEDNEIPTFIVSRKISGKNQ